MKKSDQRVIAIALASSLTIAFGACSSKSEAETSTLDNDLRQAFSTPTPDAISALQSKYKMPQARFIPECRQELGYNNPATLITNGFNSDAAQSCLKGANVRALLSRSETIEKALDIGFPHAVAVFIPECKKAFAQNTTYSNLSIEQAKQVYTCALKKGETLNWERKWYTDNYNWLK